MKRCAALVALMVLPCLTAARIPAGEDMIEPLPGDIVRIREAGELRVAQFNGERPGFFFFVEGERLGKARQAGVPVYDYQGRALIGHDVEMALSIANQIGVKLRIVRGYRSFSDTVSGVVRGEADIAMTKLSKTPARAMTAELSKPYFRADITIIVNRLREQRLPDVNDLLARLAGDGVVFGVIPATSQREWTESVFPGAEVREYADQDALFAAVNTGEVTAVLYEEFEARRFFRLWPDIALSCRMFKHPYLVDLMIFATKPGDDGLKRLVDAWLDRMRSPTTDDILDRFEPMMSRDAGAREGYGETGLSTSDSDIAALGVSAVAALTAAAWICAARPPQSRGGSPEAGRNRRL